MGVLTSVVIGFRDWGIDRLRLAIGTLPASFEDRDFEVILSDYGSKDAQASRDLAAEVGVRHVFCDTADLPWSRSRALNAGFAVARGDLFISTDADMVFAPGSMRRIVEIAESTPDGAYYLQCRDLPSSHSSEKLREHGIDWLELERVSRLRPRWGMGGMAALWRETYEYVRGLDERFHTYGGEDLDLARRAARAGARMVWIEEPGVRMYHMWHPSSKVAATAHAAGRQAVDTNVAYLQQDGTFVRNTRAWQHRPEGTAPLVTVSIATRNRSELLRQALESVLAQSVQDFEVVVVDDGGDDDTAEVVASFGDPRLRYFWKEQGGISSARNRALEVSRGRYTAVADDDDLMPPRRLEWQLADITAGVSGTSGSYINFDDETGEIAMVVSKVPTVASAIDTGGAPGHGTWLVSTDVLRRFRYDEALTSGVDNNLMLRMLRSGVRLSHVGRVVQLRRRHREQVTVVDDENQGQAARDSQRFFQWSISEARQKRLAQDADENRYSTISPTAEMIAEARPFLPDHLVTRNLHLNAPVDAIRGIAWDGELDLLDLQVDDVSIASSTRVRGASYADLRRAAQIGGLKDAVLAADDQEEEWVGQPWIDSVIDHVRQSAEEEDRFVLLFSQESEARGTDMRVSLTATDRSWAWSVAKLAPEAAEGVFSGRENAFIVRSWEGE